MKDNQINYYIPMTLNEVIDGLNGIVRNSEDLTGQELVIGAEYIDDGDSRVPPGSIGIFLQQNTLNPDEPNYGTIVLTPGKTRILM